MAVEKVGEVWMWNAQANMSCARKLAQVVTIAQGLPATPDHKRRDLLVTAIDPVLQRMLDEVAKTGGS